MDAQFHLRKFDFLVDARPAATNENILPQNRRRTTRPTALDFWPASSSSPQQARTPLREWPSQTNVGPEVFMLDTQGQCEVESQQCSHDSVSINVSNTLNPVAMQSAAVTDDPGTTNAGPIAEIIESLSRPSIHAQDVLTSVKTSPTSPVFNNAGQDTSGNEPRKNSPPIEPCVPGELTTEVGDAKRIKNRKKHERQKHQKRAKVLETLIGELDVANLTLDEKEFSSNDSDTIEIRTAKRKRTHPAGQEQAKRRKMSDVLETNQNIKNLTLNENVLSSSKSEAAKMGTTKKKSHRAGRKHHKKRKRAAVKEQTALDQVPNPEESSSSKSNATLFDTVASRYLAFWTRRYLS